MESPQQLSPWTKEQLFGTPDSSNGDREQEIEIHIGKEALEESPLTCKNLKSLLRGDGEGSDGSASHTTGLNDLEIAK